VYKKLLIIAILMTSLPLKALAGSDFRNQAWEWKNEIASAAVATAIGYQIGAMLESKDNLVEVDILVTHAGDEEDFKPEYLEIRDSETRYNARHVKTDRSPGHRKHYFTVKIPEKYLATSNYRITNYNHTCDIGPNDKLSFRLKAPRTKTVFKMSSEGWLGYFMLPKKTYRRIHYPNLSITFPIRRSICFTDLEEAFQSSVIVSVNNLNTEKVTTMRKMFHRASHFTGDAEEMEYWNTTNVTDMSGMFQQTTDFDIGKNVWLMWDTTNVTDISYMFDGAKRYSVDDDAQHKYNSYRLDKVTNMENYLSRADNFQGDLSSLTTKYLTSITTAEAEHMCNSVHGWKNWHNRKWDWENNDDYAKLPERIQFLCARWVGNYESWRF
jgi:hypothetical protein